METMQLQKATGYQLVATDAAELETAHDRMIQWARSQMQQCDVELAEERENLRIAEEWKWATAPFKRRVAMLEKRLVFYEKIEIALQAGYVIVPNFPLNVFAIRTDARAPRSQTKSGGWNGFPQSARRLPPGQGEYRNPDPDVVTHTDHESDGNGGTKVVKTQTPHDEWSDIEFPIALATPVLMSRTAEVMAARLFDEVGVAEDSRPGGDPIICGRLLNPRQGRPDLTFFVGWFFDPSRL